MLRPMKLFRHIPLRYRLPLIHGTLWRLGRWRCAGWRKADSREGLRPGDFVVSAFFNESLGIGRAGRLTAEAFQAAGYDFIAHDLRPAFRRLLDQGAQLPGEGGVWFIHANAAEAIVALLAHAPESWADRYRIGYWAWETPKAPAEWVLVADYLHEIWVPSRFVHEAVAATFHAAGREDLIVRIRTISHPVPLPEAVSHTQAVAERLAFGLRPELCEVLAMFDTKSSAVRKNPWGAIDAWTRAFPYPSETARLTLKVSDLSGDRATVAQLQSVLAERSDIRIVSDSLSDADMDRFIAAFDVLLSMHRAEGFGLPLAEAMASGVPVIATGWSGNLDFMTQTNARLVPARLIRIRDIEGPYTGLEKDPDQLWADPDLDAAARALRELAESASARRAMTVAARQAIEGLSADWQKDALAVLPFNAFLAKTPAIPPQGR